METIRSEFPVERVHLIENKENLGGSGGFNTGLRLCLEKESESNIPEFDYCTFVPVCSLIVRTEVVKKVGVMPEDNFIYWDDMEWVYLVNEAGWKVAVYRDAAIQHKTGGVATNTFARYYLWRNRIRFFGKYLPKEKYEDFAEKVLTELHRMLYGCYLKGDTNLAQSLYFALVDGICNRGGVAGEGRILKRNGSDTLAELLQKEPERAVVECKHVFEYKEPYHGEIVKDAYSNVIACEEDYYYCRNYERAKRDFIAMHVPVMLDSMALSFLY